MQELFSITKESVSMAVEYETAMAKVAKVTDELRDSEGNLTQEYYKLNKEILNYSADSAIAAKDIAAMVEDASKGGLPYNQLMDYVKLAERASIAFDMEDAGGVIRTFMSSMNLNADQTEKLLNQLNVLENTSNSNAANLASILATAGPTTQFAGIDPGTIAAFASVTGAGSFGSSDSKTASAIVDMVSWLSGGAKATKDREAAYASIGLNMESVKVGMAKDASQTIRNVFMAIAEAPQKDRIGLFKEIFGGRAYKTLGPIMTDLMQETPKLVEALKNINDAGMLERMGIEAEYQTMMKTTGNQWAKFQNRMDVLKINLGTALLPGIGSFMDAAFGPLGELIEEMEGPIKEFGDAFGKTINNVVKDKNVQGAFKELMRQAPELLGSLLPAIPTLARGVATVATALADLPW
jgi:TP901 family phage tail tape measure protein